MIDTPLQPAPFEQQVRTEITMVGSASEFLTTLINTCVAQQEPIVLIFDDRHTITNSIMQREIPSLIEHLSPHMHIILSIREDSSVSLARLREGDCMLEAGMDAPLFTGHERYGILTNVVEHLEQQKTSVSSSTKKKVQQDLRTQHASQPLLDPLSPRELEVLQLMAQGASNIEIADNLVIAFATVKRHVSNILSKLQATNRTQAVAYARHLSLLH